MSVHTALKRLVRGAAATAALALLTPTTTAANFTSTMRNSTPEAGAFVDAASLPANELRGFNHPISYADYARQQGAKPVARQTMSNPVPANDQNLLRQQCATHAERAKTARGWIKSRFESCQKRPFDLVLRDKRGTTTIGRLWFDQWVLGFTHDGDRRVDYIASIENIVVQPEPHEDATKWRIGQHFRESTNASESDADATVTAPQATERDELLGVWDGAPKWTLTYTSPHKGPLYRQGNYQRVFSTISMDLSVSSPNSSPYEGGSATYTSSVRYDYAGHVAGKHRGTVFTEARVELVLNQNDPLVDESALHIYDALNRPERTFPSWPGKTIPGLTTPLHRMIDEVKKKDNREKSIKECKKVWGNYEGSRLECDEYPFATTHEGSTSGGERFSVRLISGMDNRKSGNALNLTYTNNRVLDKDPFYVKIINE
ncbi:NucA/NucB deoxyribonuclease domain-containing protein [Streptomyces sp. NPDC127068]|uniref:NucA/NucB deoxyribonuclease domain-containing protein n=1 Tax=Streptomyces sp. NPDC127068 TaxID=3347127 RepID=UPI003667F24D